MYVVYCRVSGIAKAKLLCSFNSLCISLMCSTYMVQIYLLLFHFYRQPEFCDWAFNLSRGEKCLEKWDLIPEGVDILITHGPPIGHGDLCSSKQRAGECISSVYIWSYC